MCNFFSLGPLEEIETILSGLEYRNSSDGKPFCYKARGLMNIWALKNNATRQQGRNDVDEIAMDWEEVKIFILNKKLLKDLSIKYLFIFFTGFY